MAAAQPAKVRQSCSATDLFFIKEIKKENTKNGYVPCAIIRKLQISLHICFEMVYEIKKILNFLTTFHLLDGFHYTCG
jgi:hypothetical protein